MTERYEVVELDGADFYYEKTILKTDDLEEAMIKAVDTGYDVAVCTEKSIVKIHRTIGGWS